MSEDCLFCQIVAGDIPSRTVYEDEHTFAFLDVNPLKKGHTLVIPKDHYETLEDLPVEAAGDLFEAVRTVTPAVEDAVGADATTVAVNNGEDAGQEIPHVHFHVIPRQPGSGGSPAHRMLEGPDLPDDEMDAVAKSIAEGV
ncbi:HIT family protein [Halobacteriales archaeon Cl-PHB]